MKLSYNCHFKSIRKVGFLNYKRLIALFHNLFEVPFITRHQLVINLAKSQKHIVDINKLLDYKECTRFYYLQNRTVSRSSSATSMSS